ncbi:hypothetical protein BCR24_06500 [Enterococcus ureilyticus]|uniref:Uncharacterized protein n=1 Tax=Enterococcus ureilyticus TaxID=1131292 RepID=A0A1E5H996_9ENTE|nr:hypothetical protein [Enterococcus ureilyticus]MBM7688417.1 hypothetical protein [Enterococcus ureilyticus]OEG21519.1 hypothetical protein BCR24_06500 [Enterococcus ureilyticus]
MFAIYCKDVNLSGFVTGQLVHQGGIFVTTSRLDGSTTARIKLYKSKKKSREGYQKLHEC